MVVLCPFLGVVGVKSRKRQRPVVPSRRFAHREDSHMESAFWTKIDALLAESVVRSEHEV